MIKRFLPLFLAIFLASPGYGQNDDTWILSGNTDTIYKSFRLFEDDDLLEITLRFDLSTYFRTRPKKEYLPANITFHTGETDSISRDIKLRTRGVFRNSFCFFPPIELNLKKTDFGYTDLDSIDKIKLVTECRSGKIYEEYILREYLAYKLYSVLTDTSFRVRLLAINFIDTEKKRKPIRHYGIFIEPVEMLADRTNTFQVKTPNLTQKNIIPRIMDRMAIFNYMIGNYDWSIPGQHNVKVLKPSIFDPTGLAIAVPYDFDWTGLVDPSYAIPVEETGLESVRERLFTGICRRREVFLKDLETFSLKKEEFYRVINEFPYLNKSLKKETMTYLDGFFDQLAARNIVIEDLMNSCKNF
ncbi:MAG: hypothetical protein NTW82_09920 [Bacteroidia bacterium]|nr:hypothetical protein [Bacteroidia bacterium]